MSQQPIENELHESVHAYMRRFGITLDDLVSDT